MTRNTSARVLPDLSAIQAQLDALKAENERLKAAQSAGTKALSLNIGEYTDNKGNTHNTLTVSGNFKPFYLGLSKCKTILEITKDKTLMGQLETFVKTGGKKL